MLFAINTFPAEADSSGRLRSECFLCTFALFKPHFFDALLLRSSLPVLVTRLFDLVGAGPLDVEPLMLWPGSALISFSSVSPACMTPSSRSCSGQAEFDDPVGACLLFDKEQWVCAR